MSNIELSSINFPHLQAIADNNLKEEQIPMAIRKRMTAWKMQSKKYEKTPTKNQLDSLKRISAEVANEIQNWVENDLPDGNGQPAPEPKKQEDQPSAPAPIAGLKDAPTQSDAKDMIMAHINKEGRIYYQDLEKIMGRNLSDRISVDGLELDRSFAFYYPM